MRFAEGDVPFIRHRHGGGGPFGRGPWGYGPGGFGGPGGPGGPFGPRGRGRGRRRRGDVRIALLLLLNEGPSNGYQLMRTLEERSDGEWSPSPGSVYPALSQLEDEGLITSVQNDSEPGRIFEITDAGKAQLAERGDQKPPWEADEEPDDAFVAFKRSVVSAGKAAWQVAQDGNPEHVAKATELLNDVRRGLYRLLAGDDEE